MFNTTRITRLEERVRQLSSDLCFAKEDAARAKERASSAETKLHALLDHLSLEVEHRWGYKVTKKAKPQ